MERQDNMDDNDKELLEKAMKWSIEDGVLTKEDWDDILANDDETTMHLAMTAYQLHNEPEKMVVESSRFITNPDGTKTMETVEKYITESFDEAKERHEREAK
jgi:hypothetical protein